jgi:hypothetical protein
MSDDLLDAPNQQVVRPDGSGPADEGEGGSTAEAEANPLDSMTKAELIEEAESRGIELDATATKAEIREALG